MTVRPREETWIAHDGTSLYAACWKPAGKIKAVLAFVHGHGTHCRRYDDWYSQVLSDGIAIVTFDLRGHGRSGGKQGTIHRYNEYLSDTALLMDKTRALFPDLPVILYGHSMGATIVLSILGKTVYLPEMAVLSSAWLELVQPPGKVKSLAIWLADTLMPQVTIKTGLKSKDFNGPSATVAPSEPDPLMHKRISARCFREVQRATKLIHPGNLPGSLPMLFMHGSADRVSAPAASARLAASLPATTAYREWKEGPHQLQTWDQNHQVTRFTLDWINKHLPCNSEQK